MKLFKKAVVLLPTFNERDNLAKFVDEVLNQEKNCNGWKLEILIADSNSKDGTWEIAQSLAKKNSKIHTVSVGYGLGVGLIEGHRYSIKHFNPDALVQVDADGQVDSNVIPRLIKGIDDGYDLVLGSRFVKGGKNQLSFMRRIFSSGASWVVRVIMGPYDIQEVTNSARAFTPELFKKLNLERLPWREKTFIVQPAFLNEAILSGARYKEVPLVFKNRLDGYSKNKIVNYTYDVITYSIDARLHKMGIDIKFFKFAGKVKTFIKFGIVGFTGTLIDFIFYKSFIGFLSFQPPIAKGFSSEIAIVNNFLLNNAWTFKHRVTTNSPIQRFLIFNSVSLGGLVLAVLIVKILQSIYGDGDVAVGTLKIAYNSLYFFATVPPVMAWNFTANHFITWRQK